MSHRLLSLATLAMVAAVVPAASSPGAVSLYYSDGDALPTVGTVASDYTFTVSVILGESSAADEVTSLDYQPQISTNGIGYFKILSRSSVTANIQPYQGDASPSIAPATLGSGGTNGTVDYGGDRDTSVPGLKGVANYTIATYKFQALSTTPAGPYTLSFTGTQYGVGSPSFKATAFTAGNLGSYLVTVPEPATGLAAAVVGIVGLRRRRSER